MIIKNYKKRNSCRLCSHPNLQKFLNFPKVPPGEQLKKKFTDKHYLVPIDLYFCQKCYHVQVIHIPKDSLMWNDEYTFMPSKNTNIIKHFNSTVLYLKKNLKLNFKKAFEIGSNDGLFLSLVQNHFSSKVLGADPSLIPRKEALKNKIKTLPIYFNYQNSKKIKNKHGKFDLVIANNVFAHSDKLPDMLKGIENILEKNGYFIFEASYLLDVLKKKLIGTVIHEHLSVHSLLSLIPFLKKNNLEFVDVIHNSKIQGGVIIGIVKKINKKNTKSINFLNLLSKEKKFGLNKSSKLKQYGEEFSVFFKKFKTKIVKKIVKKNGDKNLFCIGAARSLPIMLKVLDIEEFANKVLDNNKFKFRKYLPSSYKIQIFDQNQHEFSERNMYLISAWVHTKNIVNLIKKNKIKNKKIKIITIFPFFKIYNI